MSGSKRKRENNIGQNSPSPGSSRVEKRINIDDLTVGILNSGDDKMATSDSAQILEGQRVILSKIENSEKMLANRIDRMEQEFQKTIDFVCKQQKENTDRIEQLEVRFCVLERHLIDQENRSKRDNLVFSGIPESFDTQEKLTAEVLRIIAEKMNVKQQISVERCHRLGGVRRGDRSKPRLTVIKFSFYCDRMSVWNQRRELKASGYFVQEHFAKEVEEKRQKLLPVMYECRQKGRRATLVQD